MRQTHVSRLTVIITECAHFTFGTGKSLGMQQRLRILATVVLATARLSSLCLTCLHHKLLTLLLQLMAYYLIRVVCLLL